MNTKIEDGERKTEDDRVRRHFPSPVFYLLSSILVLLLAGCAIGPNYHRSPVNAPPVFRGQTENSTNSFADLPWWQIFHDTNLQSLICVALTNNYDLRIAFAREEQARQLVFETRAELFPQANYTGIAARGKNVENANPFPGARGDYFVGDVEASWEVDLWGRVRRLTESQRAQFFAAREARRDITISLIAQVAQDYFQLLALDRQLQIARDTTNSFGQSLTLFSEQLKGGVASRLDTLAAEALMDSVTTTIPDYERQIVLQEDQLSVLLGQNPEVIARTSSTLEKQALPSIPTGLPSALLERRPDVREAEQELRSANAQVGVAIADFFPQISLTALFGQVSPSLSDITSGSGRAWGIAGDLAGPIFEGGRLKAQYREAKAAREQFLLQYDATILNAFQEVSDAIISYQKYSVAFGEQARAVSAYQGAVTTATERYRLGNANYYEVLQQQQELFPAENILVQTRLNQLITLVQLYRALGGGWNEPMDESHF
jgi:outer membrane protein, multidrug efflux system